MVLYREIWMHTAICLERGDIFDIQQDEYES